MVSDQYNDIVICVPPDLFSSAMNAEQYPGRTWGLCIRSEQDADKLEKMIKEIFSLTTTRVCLWIDEQIYHKHEQKISRLSFILYSPNYLFNYNKAVIYFVGDRTGRYESSKQALSNSVGSLGFTFCLRDVESWTQSGINDGQWFLQTNDERMSKEELSNFYFDLLTRKFFIGHDICIICSDQKKLPQILDTISETEKQIIQSHTQLHEFYHSYRILRKQLERLSNENEQLQIDLTNQKKYLAILRNEKEMEKIIEFYHKEYEVLPLWYKRFGHMIKLVTGKRKIRSTDNQK